MNSSTQPLWLPPGRTPRPPRAGLALFLPPHRVDDQVREADRDWGDTDKLDAVGDSESWTAVKQSNEGHECRGTKRDPDEPRQKEDALDIPVALFSLLLERREFGTLLDSGKALLVNHHFALVLQPLSKGHKPDKRHDHDCNFHVFTLSFHPYILVSGSAGCKAIRDSLATT